MLWGHTAGPGWEQLTDCTDGDGCAFFLRIDESLAAIGPPLLVSARADRWAGDHGYAAWITEEGDALIVGSSDGALGFRGAIPAPPPEYVHVYFARAALGR